MGNPEVSESDLAYLAGIIDGEGSICVDWSPPRKDGAKRPIVKMCVANTNWHIISTVKCLFWKLTGRKYAAGHPAKLSERHHQRWQVFVNRKKSCAQILSSVLPYLRAKKEQALRALQICEWKHTRNSPIPRRILDAAVQVKWLNMHPFQPDRLETVETVRWTPEGEETVQARSNAGVA